MNIFIVNQNPDSKYNDEEGRHYDFPTSIPNGRQIKLGDVFIFNLAAKIAKKQKLGDKRLTGIAKIDNITFYNQNGKEMALASYYWYKKFETPLSFEDIGGDPRCNVNFAMNKISVDKQAEILLQIIKHN
jgi:hypothetical protein